MNLFNEVHRSSLVDFELHRPSAVTHYPHSAECGSRWSTYGSSSSWSSNVLTSAAGEYFERKHFYLDVPVNKVGKLDQELSLAEHTEFSNAFRQTSTNPGKISLETHEIELTKAYRAQDLSTCHVPTACISITKSKRPTDNLIYPMRDTCGCSAHTSVELAILGAIKESLERQFLLKFWLTKKCQKQISYNLALDTLGTSPSAAIFREFNDSGELCVLDISDYRFPGACVLLCYGRQEKEGIKVQYCAGMAYAKNIKSALEKSILELWQTFRFMLSRDQNCEDVEDPYLRHFLNCNKYTTFNKILTDNKFDASYCLQKNTAPFNTMSLFEVIRKLQINGYLYLDSSRTEHGNFTFCKYFSPNLFLHMNNASHLNIKNRYSHPFHSEIISEQLTTMVPFP